LPYFADVFAPMPVLLRLFDGFIDVTVVVHAFDVLGSPLRYTICIHAIIIA
jgi:hypothetical protein